MILFNSDVASELKLKNSSTWSNSVYERVTEAVKWSIVVSQTKMLCRQLSSPDADVLWHDDYRSIEALTFDLVQHSSS